MALIAGAMLALGCNDVSSPVSVPASDPLIAQLVALGFRKDMIADRGDRFVVEGDIEIRKRDIPKLARNTQVRTLPAPGPGIRPNFQWVTNARVGQTQVYNIKVSLTGLGSVPEWQAAARQAMTDWNAVNCANIRLVEGSPANITVSTYTDAGSVAAIGSFPTSAGQPGPTIRVNTQYTGSPNTAGTKRRNMAHELGHTIGFRHTNWQSQGETSSDANLVAGTPQTDAASVMNGSTATTDWAGFSFYDQKATKTLYPGLCANLSGPTTVWPNYNCSWTANTTGGTAPYQYSWMGGAFGAGRTFIYHNSGSSFTMRVAVLDATGRRNDMSQSVTVNQYGPACG